VFTGVGGGDTDGDGLWGAGLSGGGPKGTEVVFDGVLLLGGGDPDTDPPVPFEAGESCPHV
jgi:hypothetical protein